MSIRGADRAKLQGCSTRSGGVIPYCETPWQSVAAAVAGGVAGGASGVALGLDPVAVVLLAGGLGGVFDLVAHVVRRDPQFVAAVEAAGGRDH